MAIADQAVNGHLGGVDPDTGDILEYQFNAEALGRCTYSSNDHAGPYTTEFEKGNPVVGSSATYDQVRSINHLQGSRHIDPFGEMVTPKKVWLVQWYWMLDGCPQMTRAKLAEYKAKADVLRPWPTTVIAAMAAQGYEMPASEGTPHDYSTVDPNATLDSLT
jgi:hypothetical protein